MPDRGSPDKEAGLHPSCRLIAVHLDEASLGRGSPDEEHERQAAIYDLIEENVFVPMGCERGPFILHLALRERRLVFDVRTERDNILAAHLLSLTPLRRVIADYFLICQSYYAAIRTAMPSQIETIDMARRALHDEAASMLRSRLEGKIATDHATARRLFTLVCALHRSGGA